MSFFPTLHNKTNPIKVRPSEIYMSIVIGNYTSYNILESSEISCGSYNSFWVRIFHSNQRAVISVRIFIEAVS